MRAEEGRYEASSTEASSSLTDREDVGGINPCRLPKQSAGTPQDRRVAKEIWLLAFSLLIQLISRRRGIWNALIPTVAVGRGLASLNDANSLTQYFDCWFGVDRKSTRLNSSHQIISYAVFSL